MSSMVSKDRKFMGITIEGDYTDGRYYYDQKPMSELVTYFKQAFDKGIKAIAWTQYTPYFNDGEPCEFGVGGLSFTSNPKVVSAWLDDDAGDQEDDRYYDDNGNEVKDVLRTDMYSYESPWSDTRPHPDGYAKGEIEIPRMVHFEQVLNETFGDHTTVIATPDRVVQFEYSHD